jgi:hypothetical protein
MNSNPFEDVKKLFNGEEIKVSSPFVVNKILSFSPITFILVRNHNKVIGKIPKSWSDKIFQCVTKRNKIPFIRYAKKRRETEKKLIQKICCHFVVNEYHAIQTIDLLRRQGEEPEKYFGLKRNE